MHRTIQDIEEEALKLPSDERGRLVAKLLDSLEPADSGIDQKLIEEAEARAEDLRSGKVTAEPVGQVLARLHAKFG